MIHLYNYVKLFFIEPSGNNSRDPDKVCCALQTPQRFENLFFFLCLWSQTWWLDSPAGCGPSLGPCHRGIIGTLLGWTLWICNVCVWGSPSSVVWPSCVLSARTDIPHPWSKLLVVIDVIICNLLIFVDSWFYQLNTLPPLFVFGGVFVIIFWGEREGCHPFVSLSNLGSSLWQGVIESRHAGLENRHKFKHCQHGTLRNLPVPFRCTQREKHWRWRRYEQSPSFWAFFLLFSPALCTYSKCFTYREREKIA